MKRDLINEMTKDTKAIKTTKTTKTSKKTTVPEAPKTPTTLLLHINGKTVTRTFETIDLARGWFKTNVAQCKDTFTYACKEDSYRTIIESTVIIKKPEPVKKFYPYTVTCMNNETEARFERKFENEYQMQLFINKVKHSKTVTYISDTKEA